MMAELTNSTTQSAPGSMVEARRMAERILADLQRAGHDAEAERLAKILLSLTESKEGNAMKKLLPLGTVTALLAGCATLPKADVATAGAVEAGTVPASSARLVLREGRTETYPSTRLALMLPSGSTARRSPPSLIGKSACRSI